MLDQYKDYSCVNNYNSLFLSQAMNSSDLDTTNAKMLPARNKDLTLPVGTIKRNFFDLEDIDIEEGSPPEASSPTKLLEKKEESSTRKKHKNIRLKPLQKSNPEVIELHQIKSARKEQRQQQENTKQKQPQSKKKTGGKLNFQISSEQQQQQSPEREEIIKSQSKTKKQAPKKKQRQESVIASNSRNERQNMEQNVQQNAQDVIQQNEEAPQVAEQQNQRNQNQQPSQGRRISMGPSKCYLIRRDNQWLNKLWPQFNLHFLSNNEYCFSAKLTGNNKETTFTICQGKDNFAQNGQNYLGKVKANFTGSVINVYGPGYNPTDYKNKNLPLRDLLATIEYQTNFFGSTRPRNFKVYVLKSQLSYYDDLQGPLKGEDEIPLNQLYNRGDNKHKIMVMNNRKPEWNQQIKGFMLNFGGRVKKPSIKNFILEDEDDPNIVRLVFGKIEDNQFRLDVANSIAPLVGFGIALSTFGGKIGCE